MLPGVARAVASRCISNAKILAQRAVNSPQNRITKGNSRVKSQRWEITGKNPLDNETGFIQWRSNPMPTKEALRRSNLAAGVTGLTESGERRIL